MNDRVKLSVFYPHSVEKVWQALTDCRILNTWMMNNNFEPRIGHKFKFESESLPGIKTIIYCEVVELEPLKRLAYTWQDEITSESTLVVWTLTDVEGGTQLQLKHLQRYAMSSVRDWQQINNSHNLYRQPIALTRQTLTVSWHQMLKDELNSIGDRQKDWHYRLNHKLPEVLAHYC